MKKIAITQPNYLPWLGYFELLDAVDLWIVLDNVMLGSKSFVNRNRILINDSEVWLTISLESRSQKSYINNVNLNMSGWWNDHLNKLRNCYRNSKYYNETMQFLEMILPPKENLLSDYNLRIVSSICELLEISVEIKKASDYAKEYYDSPQDRILELCDVFNASQYYNFKKGVDIGLYNAKVFKDAGISIFKQEYIHPIYSTGSQMFKSYMSIVDLLFHHYDASLEIIRSGRNWIKVASE